MNTNVSKDTSFLSEEEVKLSVSSAEEETVSNYENECVGCKQDYRVMKWKDEWLQCV